MDTLYGLLIFSAFCVIAWFWRKGMNATSKVINQKVLYRAEHKHGQELVSQVLSYETTASAAEIIAALEAKVPTVKDRPNVLADLYELNRDQNHIIYALGNAVYPKMIVAGVTFTPIGDRTKCEYKIYRWRERDGLVEDTNLIQRLRKQVKSAFEAADVNAKSRGYSLIDGIDESGSTGAMLRVDNVDLSKPQTDGPQPMYSSIPPDDSADPAIKYCSQCGTGNKLKNSFCSQCGSKI